MQWQQLVPILLIALFGGSVFLILFKDRAHWPH
jgi:hypothetical protein